MWTRLRSSLTLRIFALTFAFMMLACGVTYAAISWLTPISYTELLRDELQRAGEALVQKLSEGTQAQSAGVLEDFARETGAYMRLADEDGNRIYDTLPATQLVEAVTIVQAGGDAVLEEKSATEDVCEGALASGEGADGFAQAQADAEQIASTVEESDAYAQAEAGEEMDYAFRFKDGAGARLTVRGGRRAVNQAAEAMRRLMPALTLMLLIFSLLGALFYARMITRPIVEIGALAQRIAHMDFSARWTGARRDEIGRLGENLNCLSDNLSGAMAELRAANAALSRDIERERELDRQRMAFFSAASHELKTPVTILRGQLSGMLAQVGIYRNREKYLARALEVTGRMENLIREILTISRIDSGGLGAGSAMVNLSALMARQLEMDGELIEQRELRLRTDIAPEVMLRGNEGLLSNALDNVLMNAILYSPRGAEISVALTAEGFAVENSGASIDEAALQQIFDPFYRVEPSRNRRSGGSGLGLYLVKSVLRLHGADCAVENTPGGVRFSARFNAVQEMRTPANEGVASSQETLCECMESARRGGEHVIQRAPAGEGVAPLREEDGE